MRIIALVYFILLGPILAMEDYSIKDNPFIQLYHDRIREGQKSVTELQQENKTTLHGKDNVVASVNEQIHEKRLRLPAPTTFLEELDALLKLLPHPEDLLTVEQRRALIGFPVLEHLHPLIKVMEFLGKFIKKWQSLTAHAEILQLAAKQTIWYQPEWTNLILEMSDKLTHKTIRCGDLLKIYKWTSYFHTEVIHLETSYVDLKSILQKAQTSIPKDLGYLDFMFHELTSFFQVRGRILWEIIRYSNLVITVKEAQNLAENYEDLPDDFFLHNANFIKKILEETDDSVKISILVPIHPNHFSSKNHSTNSHPIPPQKHSSPIIRQVQSTPQTRIGSPLPPRKKAEIPKGSFEKRLEEAFMQPNQWNRDIISFKEKVLLLIHAKFIVAPLDRLFNYYDNFRISYLRNHDMAYDILSPKAYVDIPGQPLVVIPQSKARKISSLKSNGHLCFNLPECDEETTVAFSGYIGNLKYEKRRELYPSQTREQFFQFWFENLFGISSDPALVCACDHVSFYAPKENRQQPNPNTCSEKYIANPNAWSENQNLDFITIHRRHKGDLFLNVLNQIAVGHGSFKERFDPNSIGLRILFGFLTRECASPQNFELVKNGRKFNIKRVGSDSFLQPSFMLTKDQNHHFIGQNIFYFLPFMDEEIPEEVKGNFASNHMLFGLSDVLAQLAKNQRDFDEFIQKHKLTEEDDLVEMLGLQAKLSKANVLGLTLTARKETIQELIHNFTIIKKQLPISGITYGQILQELNPLEYNCYQQVLKNARKKTQTAPIFFTKIIPSLIEQLREVHERAMQLGEQPLYSWKDLDLFEQASDLYRKKITEYLETIEHLNDERIRTNLRKEAAIINEREIPILREKLISPDTLLEGKDAKILLKYLEVGSSIERTLSGTLVTPEGILEEKSAKILLKHLEEKNSIGAKGKHGSDISPLISIKQAGLTSLVENTEIDNGERPTSREELLYGCLVKEIDKKIEENTQKLALIRKKIEDIETSLKDLSHRLLPEHLFKEFQDRVSQIAQTFFRNKYRWAEENHIFHASVVLKAWEGILDTEKPVIYETFIKSTSLPDWIHVPMFKNQFATICDPLIESNHPLESMVQDLINHPDIPFLPPHMVLEILDRLLTLTPHPDIRPENWQRMLSLAGKEFLGMTPHVQSFFHSLGLHPNEEANTLQNAQLQRFEDYGRRIKMATGNHSEQPSTAEQFASHLLHQLWAGPLELDKEKDQVLFDGLIKFFSLPLYSSQSSAGFATNPESKGGIFDLRYKVGDHYPLIKSPEWIKLFGSSYLLPEKLRLNFLSHARHLLLFQWLDVLKQFYPSTLFHPWYPKTAIGKTMLLQEFLRTSTSFTFDQIMAYVWLEFYFVTEQDLNNHHNDVDLTLKSQANETHKLIPIENGVSLDYHKHGKNMLTLLHEWDEEHRRCMFTSPLTLDDAATEWLADLNPTDYEPEILARILNLATHFAIDPKQINPALWNNAKILTDLVSVNAPLKCLHLVVALRTGLQIQDIILKKSKSSYTISGLRGNVGLVCELIPLFPEVTSLSLTDNQLRSLKPLIPSLKKLPSLTSLCLSNNPIHNPAFLIEFPKLISLDIENTGIPNIYPKDLKKLIAREMKIKVENVNLLENVTFFRSELSGTLKISEQPILKESPPTLLERIRNYMKHTDFSLENMDTMICILERLGEGLWLDTLALERHTLNIPCDTLFGLIQEFDPREIAYKLLVALKFGLPHGTNPDTLSFVNNIPSIQPNCLTRLDVSKVLVNPQFLQSLCQFENLFHLTLTEIGLIDLDNLPILRQLRVLNLRNNKIQTLTGLHTNAHDIKFPELNILNLNNNKICTNIGISFLRELIKLTYLNLSSNELTEMPSLGNLLLLQGLDLRENKISSKQMISYVNQGNFFYTPQRQ